MQYHAVINGYPVSAHYDDQNVEEIFIPLLRRLQQLHESRARRIIAFIAAPPATGKSTLVDFLSRLAAQLPGMPAVQALGMDGFHYHQDYILSHTVVRNGKEIEMRRVKGAPDTFDVQRLRDTLLALRAGNLRWPAYDRTLHDVVEEAIPVTAPILLVEGNYLLLNQPIWRDLPRDYALFITADEGLLRQRLIERKMRGDKTHEQAALFYQESDGPNVRLCLGSRLPCDLELQLLPDGTFMQRS